MSYFPARSYLKTPPPASLLRLLAARWLIYAVADTTSSMILFDRALRLGPRRNRALRWLRSGRGSVESIPQGEVEVRS